MSERPTPETERIKGALHTNWNDLVNHARKLERERDEWAAMCGRYKQERDEARQQVKELIYIASRSISLAEIDFENDKFGIVSELRYELTQIMQEGAK